LDCAIAEPAVSHPQLKIPAKKKTAELARKEDPDSLRTFMGVILMEPFIVVASRMPSQRDTENREEPEAKKPDMRRLIS
jgi:hypothetical protein